MKSNETEYELYRIYFGFGFCI